MSDWFTKQDYPPIGNQTPPLTDDNPPLTDPIPAAVEVDQQRQTDSALAEKSLRTLEYLVRCYIGPRCGDGPSEGLDAIRAIRANLPPSPAARLEPEVRCRSLKTLDPPTICNAPLPCLVHTTEWEPTSAALHPLPESRETRIEGWARREPTMEELYSFRSTESFRGKVPSTRGFSVAAALIIHPSPTSPVGEK